MLHPVYYTTLCVQIYNPVDSEYEDSDIKWVWVREWLSFFKLECHFYLAKTRQNIFGLITLYPFKLYYILHEIAIIDAYTSIPRKELSVIQYTYIGKCLQ